MLQRSACSTYRQIRMLDGPMYEHVHICPQNHAHPLLFDLNKMAHYILEASPGSVTVLARTEFSKNRRHWVNNILSTYQKNNGR